MKKLLIITGDYNDADYTRSIHVLDTTNEYNLEILELLPKISNALKNCSNRHNWPEFDSSNISIYELYNGILTEDEIEIFSEYIPNSEYGIHSIKYIDIYDITSITNYYSK